MAISDHVRCFRMLDIWVIPGGWGNEKPRAQAMLIVTTELFILCWFVVNTVRQQPGPRERFKYAKSKAL